MKDRNEIEEEAIQWYISNEHIYKKLAKKIKNIITEILNLNGNNYHIVTSRSKNIESFRKKISNDKYDDPINQIKDLTGIRIITYVEDEVKHVCNTIENTFNIDKENSLDKSHELGIDKVGYKSVHYIASLKEDRLKLPEYKIFEGKYFEVQVRTILQHAWAEIEHDRNYKFSGKLPDEISRRFKLLAGSLEISDREFNNISKEIDSIAKDVEIGTKKGNLDFEINSTSLHQYIETKFHSLQNLGFSINNKISAKTIEELKYYGILTLKDLDTMIPDDLIDVLNKNKENLNNSIGATGIIRLLMIINDKDKYFETVWGNSWKTWSAKRDYKKVFEHYGINWDDLYGKYKVKLS